MRDKQENLIPTTMRSKGEARELGRKGGVASGVARRKKKLMRELLEEVMARKMEGGATTAEGITVALVEKALAGDTKAYEIVRDTLGEKPIEKRVDEHLGEISIKWQQK